MLRYLANGMLFLCVAFMLLIQESADGTMLVALYTELQAIMWFCMICAILNIVMFIHCITQECK